MNYYFAPMEGYTGYIYRNAHNKYFNTIDKYFAPFISANSTGKFKSRALHDILPEHNEGLIMIPQILTNNSQDFIHTSKRIHSLGYTQINLNLGCPSGTVVAKNRGSGFLAKTKELDDFLHEIFSQSLTEISVKTRLGKNSAEEFYELIEIFNKYPIKELTIHPRTQRDFYKNTPNLKVFKDGLKLSKNAICYNGDIFTTEDYNDFISNFPNVSSVMLGRGLLVNPALTQDIKNNIKLDKYLLKDFHDTIYSGYKRILYGDINVLHKMKALWFYMICVFSENKKYGKKIKKSTRLSDYDNAVSSLFKDQTILDHYEDNLIFKA